MTRSLALCATLGWLVAGCSNMGSALDTINPFAPAPPKFKPVELKPIQPKAEIRAVWQGSVGASGEYVLSPAVVGKSVYVAARDGSLARYENGSQLWRVSAGQPLSGGVGASEKLVVVGTSKGDVLAFNAADGRAAWQARVSSEVLAAPAISGDLVVIRSGDTRLFGLEVADGKRRWVYQRSTPALALRSNVGVTLDDKVLYAGFPGGKLVAVSLANGGVLWESTVALPRGTTELERIADVASEPVVEGRNVCAVAYQGRVACFDRSNGSQVWGRDVSSTSGLAIGSRALYVSDEKGAVHAFDRNSGASLWKQDQLFMRSVGRPLALAGRVAVADYQGVVHLLSEDDGNFVARFTTDGSAIFAAPQRLDGDVVVQTRNGAVYGLTVK